MNATARVSVDRIFLESTLGLTPAEIDRKLGLARGEARRLMTGLWALESAAYREGADEMGARRIKARLRAIRNSANRAADNLSDEELRNQQKLDAWVDDVVRECEERERKADREAQCSL